MSSRTQGSNRIEAGESAWLIVCLSHLKWTGSLFQRPQQVMLRLSQSHPVLYSYPMALREWGDMLLRGEPARQSLALSPKLTLLRPRALLPAWGGRLPRFERFNDRRFMDAVCRAARHVPPQRRILWYYYPRYLELIDALEPFAVVYECMDNYIAQFHRKDTPAGLKELEALERDEPALLQRADIVFYGAHTLMEERPAYRAKSHHVPTGVDVKHFARGGRGSPPSAIGAIRKPILGYWGAVDHRVDFDLLHHTAVARPDWSIVLLGPLVALRRETIEHFLRLPNVHWLGPQQYEDIPDYARAFDICLLPFKVSSEGRYLNPTKTLEYLATGKPVLSTRIPDVERFYRDTVAIAGTRDEFMEAASRLLEHDTDAAKARRLATAQGRSWEAVAQRMWSLVDPESRARLKTPGTGRR